MMMAEPGLLVSPAKWPARGDFRGTRSRRKNILMIIQEDTLFIWWVHVVREYAFGWKTARDNREVALQFSERDEIFEIFFHL